jgi:hypothetical protein
MSEDRELKALAALIDDVAWIDLDGAPPLELPITLFVSGHVLVGTLVSRRSWLEGLKQYEQSRVDILEEVAKGAAQSRPHRGVEYAEQGGALHNLLEEFKQRREDRRSDAEESGCFIHLREARLTTPGRRSERPPLRFRLDSVDGWSYRP